MNDRKIPFVTATLREDMTTLVVDGRKSPPKQTLIIGQINQQYRDYENPHPLPSDNVFWDDSHPEFVLIEDARKHPTVWHRIPRDKPRELESPGFWKRALSYLKAQVKHTLDRRKKCSLEQIEARYAACIACPLFEKKDTVDLRGYGRCSSCGCPVHQEDVEPNKLRWKSEQCPKGKW